jgi:transposase-like protein
VEAYYAGVSTRKMEQIFKQISMADIDCNIVSRRTQEKDDQVRIWKERLLDPNYVNVWLDAIYIKLGQKEQR